MVKKAPAQAVTGEKSHVQSKHFLSRKFPNPLPTHVKKIMVRPLADAHAIFPPPEERLCARPKNICVEGDSSGTRSSKFYVWEKLENVDPGQGHWESEKSGKSHILQ